MVSQSKNDFVSNVVVELKAIFTSCEWIELRVDKLGFL
jgi:hypothetical protein